MHRVHALGFLGRSLLPVLALALLLPAHAAAAAVNCRADFNDSDAVDTVDLTFLLANWDEPEPDFNGDGIAGCFELEGVLGQWGTCPCLGDTDSDLVVGDKDLQKVLDTWGNFCATDLDANGFHSDNDVDALNCQWGTSDPTADFDDSGTVDVGDLLILLGNFSTDCTGDVNRDGTVDVVDLTTVLGNWGRCDG